MKIAAPMSNSILAAQEMERRENQVLQSREVHGRTLLFALAFSLVVRLSAQSPEKLVLLSPSPMHYPPIARAAHAEGDVTLSFTIDEQGATSNVTYQSGPQMLSSTVMEAVKGWHFALPLPENTQQTVRKAVFHFLLHPPGDGYDDPGGKTTVEIRSPEDIEVVAIATTGLFGDGCPSASEKQPPVGMAPVDYVELYRSACYGSCPAYTVRVHRDGSVEWNGDSSVSIRGQAKEAIPPSNAATLLRNFQAPEFWALCSSYSRSVTDSATTGISVNIAGRSKTISVYADSAPPLYGNFEMEIDGAADTHRWRHGDPRTEPLSNIDEDAYFSKPGTAPLMIAADKDEAKTKQLIASGADINALDSSGWTALMYAAGSYGSSGLGPLLEAGADGNHQSPQGDTALMAAALKGELSEELLAKGAKINIQNRSGVTVLMLLADRGLPNEIEAALKAGANSLLKDTKGRTALDYLHLANCGKTAIPRTRNEWMILGYQKCNAMDKHDFQKSEALLKKANRK
jgi:TonB family protein